MKRWTTLLVLAILAILAGIATYPLWHLSGNYLFTADGFAHLFRVVEFDRAIQQGIGYPRWAFAAAYGYGYPLLNFYAPLSYYIAEMLHVVGFAIPHAILGVFALGAMFALSGAYTLGRELFDSRTGLLVAIAYVFFPYFLLDIYARGALGEAFAAAVLPWTVWTWHRAMTRNTMSAVLVAALGLAALVFSHNLVAYLAAPLLAAYMLWQLRPMSKVQRFPALLRLGASIVLGALLTAIFWLPVFAELALISGSHSNSQLYTILQKSFLSLDQLIQPALAYQYMDDPYPLPLVPMFLSLLAFVLALLARPKNSNVIFFGSVMLVAAILLLDWAQGIWRTIPLLSTSQFAWRVMVVIGLGVAITIGALSSLIAQRIPLLRFDVGGIGKSRSQTD